MVLVSHVDLEGVGAFPFRGRSLFDILLQSNILVSNSTPPCTPSHGLRLYDHGLRPYSTDGLQCATGGRHNDVNVPELLVPQEFGKEHVVPAPEADIYAFWLVTFHVSERGCGNYLSLCMHSPGVYR